MMMKTASCFYGVLLWLQLALSSAETQQRVFWMNPINKELLLVNTDKTKTNSQQQQPSSTTTTTTISNSKQVPISDKDLPINSNSNKKKLDFQQRQVEKPESRNPLFNNNNKKNIINKQEQQDSGSHGRKVEEEEENDDEEEENTDVVQPPETAPPSGGELEYCLELSYIFSQNAPDESCYCDYNDNFQITLYCENQCQICDTGGDTCGVIETAYALGPGFGTFTFTNITATFTYTTDGDDREGDMITLDTYNCDSTTLICFDCDAYLNSERCDRCEICDTESGLIAVDCTNVVDPEEGSMFDMCTDDAIEGIFEAIMFENYICDSSVGPVSSNGICSNATVLSPDENPSEIQTLNGATSLDIIPLCYRLQPETGVWFSIVGTGNLLTVSTCSVLTFAETYVSVFQNGCESLDCVPDAVQQFQCPNHSPGNTISWQSEAGVVYHVKAGSIYGDVLSQFEINLFEVSESSQVCGGELEQVLEIDGPPVGGWISDLFEPSDDPCLSSLGFGAWYRIDPVPEDAVLRVSTCSGLTNFLTGFSVLEGDDCEMLSCVATSDLGVWFPGCNDGGAEVEFAVNAGVAYRVLVFGDIFNDIGIFSLTLESLNPPPNDACDGAIELSLGDSVEGSLVDATLEGEDFIGNGTTCGLSSVPGVWYAVVGIEGPMRVSACSTMDFNTVQLYIYDGGSCDALRCLSSGSDGDNSSCRYGSSSVAWDSDAGEIYYLLVQSYYTGRDFDVLFTLTVDEAFPPDNDDCSAAIPITPGSEEVFGSTTDAIFDGIDSCIMGSPTPGLWYSVVGTGQAMRADTCSGSVGDPEISVFSGTCGSDLVCIGSNDDSPLCGLNSVVSWPTVAGVQYYIRVKSLFEANLEFYLTLTEFERVENDVCEMGFPVLPGESVVGTMEGASQDVFPDCYNAFGFGGLGVPGVWYYVDATESLGLRASTCSPLTTVYSAILVFGGSCDSLSCIDSVPTEDFDCRGTPFPGGTATWFGEAGQRYYLLVIGYSEVSFGGDFELTITAFEPIGNDRCEGAIELDPADVEVGTLEGATTLGEGNATQSCSFFGGAGVWYSLTGNGNPMRVSGCSSEIDVVLSVYNGTCGSLNCSGTGVFWPRCESFSGAAVTIDSVAGEVYHVLVQSFSTEGEFELRVEDIVRPENDECSAAIGPLEPGSEEIFGSTLDAEIDEVLGCGSVSRSAALWYSVVGTGGLFRADTCSLTTNFDTEIAVYSGSCDSPLLECLESNDDGCGFSSSITWQSVEGELYLIRVSGYGGSIGDFGLRVNAIEPAENGECSTRTALAPGDSIIQTLDVLSEEEPLPVCFFEPPFNSIWFEVVGTGSVLSVSTCSPNTYTESLVIVYQGGCGSLECVPSASQRQFCANFFGGGSITWESEAGVSYKVMVGSRFPSGEGNNNNNNNGEDDDYYYGYPIPEVPPDGIGAFTQVEVSLLEISSASSVCSEESLFLEVDGPPVTGFVSSVAPPDEIIDTCSRAYLPGAYYRVESPVDGVLRASTCSGITDFSTGISIMQGTDCANSICVGAAGPFEFIPDCGDGGTQVDWQVTLGEAFYVLIHGDYDQIGIFELAVTSLTPPANDVCDRAIELSLDGPTSGSLANATMVGQDVTSNCSFVSSPGVWYSIVGNGNPMRVSMCSSSFDASLSAYGGSCTSLSCVGQGDFFPDPECREGSSSLGLETVTGETYYILVQGSPFDEQDVSFDLTVTEIMPPDNDDCSSALGPIELNSGLISGSTTDAIYDGVDLCSIGGPSGALWYSVVGSGQIIQADTCSSDSLGDPEIAIFDGACGSELNCLGSNDDFCGLNSKISWLSVEGVEYFIRVKGLFSPVDFNLNISAFDPVENDFCTTSLPLKPGDSLVGTVAGATGDFDLPFCDEFFFPEAPGVWYYVDGENMGLSVTLCSPEFSFFGFLQVYSGACDELFCATSAREEFCGGEFPGFVANWFGEEGQRYYILVNEVRTEGGTYELSLSTFEGPDNDSCSSATELTVDGPPVLGSTSDATSDTSAVCRYSNSPGVWYSIVGTGMLMNVTTCSEELNFDAVITVSEGPCDDQECLSYAVYNELNCFSTFFAASTAVWFAEANVTYYIYVQSGNDFDAGEFALTVTTTETAENDACSAALPIDTNGTLVTGSTVGGSYDASIPLCSSFESPDLWYSVEGTGGFLTASLCHSETDYDTAIAVYLSLDGGCDEMECIRTNDDSTGIACSPTKSEVSWFSGEGLRYLIRVHGFSLRAGNFGLTVTSDGGGGGGTGDAGDTCFDAIEVIPDGSLIVGSTVGASVSENIQCGPRSPDIWYAVNGTGGRMDADLCSDQTVFDTYLSLFSSEDGNCATGFTVCEGNDDSCGLASSLSWRSEIDVLYYVRVHGFGSDTGNYGLTISANQVEPPENDVCEDATEIFPDGSVITGSTDNAIVSDITCGRPTPDSWYFIEGTGSTMTATLCNDETNFDTYLSLFSSIDGDCSNGFLGQCLTDDDGGCGLSSEITWTTEEGVLYFLRVHGFGSSTGSFGLSVDTSSGPGEGPENDFCEGAIELDAASLNTVSGDTTGAFYSGAPACVTATFQSADLWYRVEGDGDTLFASTCSEATNFDTQIAVFEGDCANLNCVDGNDDACGVQSSVEWVGEPFTTYYVRVFGYSFASGPFELTVGPSIGGFNDRCQNAVTVEPFSSYEGTTIGATSDPLLAQCGDSTAAVGSGVWYTLIGDGFPIAASTCQGITNFDTQITVFTGVECQGLECVDGNDQSCGDQSLVEWLTIPGMQYYILVHGYLSSEGDFTLDISYTELVEEENEDDNNV